MGKYEERVNYNKIREPSVRQLEILQLIAEGYDTREAAEVLGLSRETVRTHMANLHLRMKTKSQAHAVAVAMRGGLIE